MEQFELFDQVQLTEAIPLSGEMSNALEPWAVAPVGTTGTIVEVLEPGEAFLVELFGDWVVLEDEAGLKRSTHEHPSAFRETLGVEVVKAAHMNLLHRPNPVKSDLFRLLDAMPESLLAEVQDFAEFLQQRHGPAPHPSSVTQ
ncbi:DUF2281 domain-containing protein [Nodosilinea sp. E11]|uniref:DUF2281 domain-containing protein n=1 Tax=Nodosilinea sp. E11 TaxID=3037479 RepID=UPI0029350353|nr:hypothetical protein [Nodosilinea sp. E11]WOD41483.1 hypothetical protein RRF56_11825 [Nodosilinea sp. E11]